MTDATASAVVLDEASAVGTLSTSTASFAGSAKQSFERYRISRGIGIADNVDGIGPRPGRRQRRIEPSAGVRRNLGERAAEIDQAIDGEHADPAAIGQDRETIAGKRLKPPERFGGVEQFVEIEHPQQSGATKGGVIDRVRSRERAGVSRGGRGALRCGGPP